MKRTVTFGMELDADQLQELIAALEAAQLWSEIVEELRCDRSRLTASVPARRRVRGPGGRATAGTAR